MREQEGTQNLVFLENDAAEATFPDNSSDIGEEPGKQYKENYWRKDEDFTFKSKKKMFVKAADKIIIKVKKGVLLEIDNNIITIVDCRMGQNCTEIDIEIPA